MISSSAPPSRVVVNAAAVTGILLIMAAMIWIMYHYTRPAPVNEARARERKAAREEINAQGREALISHGWIDQSRGVTRLSIARAMELVSQEWQDPMVGRSKLLARYEKAAPRVPPASPATNAPTATNPPVQPVQGTAP